MWRDRFEYYLKSKKKRPPIGDRFFLAPQTGLEPVTPRLTAACSASWAIEAYLIFVTWTCDTLGQKHSRLTRLERFVILLVFSYSMSWLIVHRTVKTSRQLTAAMLTNEVEQVRELSRWQKKIKGYSKEYPLILAPQTGLEPVTPRLTAACSASWAIEAY